ncbi:asparagine synthase (glutamine-hydrolysing) [Pseudobutyrivibrio sp. ACV-2]|uniref:asparagine synthase (glutamine-hydrolyzing) n=1 Tax=Pseudobutyrivibrio sp. ACV-2 TaxID=1520801 RepID=UPI0008982A37|nr:asparagine synthase (glutamine-hydrolyzing) [Pseudobutyrivibrio sp. ACV-2]SEA06525.1 asparagine synthase (glutamine-hydrolysing) [Pseudobutyrivibrio sp. ACV-2]
MCGICGIIDKTKNVEGQVEIVQKMMDVLYHRGPDDRAYHTDLGIILGFVRLSILDLESGMQPMQNEDKTVTVVCNGEIYNYRELRDELKAKGHIFHTQCDVEVISHMYEQYGPDFIKRLNGQFAIGLYDKKNDLVFLGRDQVGIAPLFYTRVGEAVVFASEIKALLKYPGVSKELDLTAIDQMISFPGIIAPRTVFKGINSLESGHYLIIKNGEITNTEYWDLLYDKEIKYKDENEAAEALKAELEKAVRYRLNASVPVGFYISGGLDSSIIASLINMVGSDTIRHSFSIDFTAREISERKYQQLVQKQVKSIHHERLFGIGDIVSNLKDAVYYSESVLKETYNTASYVLSGLVHENNMKVVLTGEGADELFGGYVGYKFDKMREASKAQRMSQLTKEDMEINDFLWGDPCYTYEKNHGSFLDQRRKLFSNKLVDSLKDFDCSRVKVVDTKKLEHMDLLQKRSYLDFKMRLSDHLLSDHGDRMAMGHSVEARYPILDINVIETAMTIPSEMKLKGYDEKYILKKIAEGIVPKEIVKRPKFAFVAPGSSDILKQNDEYINEILNFDRIKSQGIFDPEYVEELKKQYSQPDFKLNLPYDSDMLIIVITTGILMDIFEVAGV